MTSNPRVGKICLLLAMIVGMAARAHALPAGQLVQSGCVSDPSTGICSDGTRLLNATFVAVSPDGLNAYATAPESNSLGVFDRSPAGGKLTQKAGTAGCFTSDGSNGACTLARGLHGSVSSVAVSPDGKNVYVTSGEGLAIFDRDLATGALTQKAGAAGCVTDSGGVCALGSNVDSAFAIAITPDGESLYMGIGRGDTDAGLALFDRNPATGGLTQKAGAFGCITRSGRSGMCMIGGALGSIGSIALSPDGNTAYVTAFAAFIGSIAVLRRDPATGILTQESCLATVDILGCPSFSIVGGPIALAVSPDGKNVYVAGFADGVATLDRDQVTGALMPRTGPTACISQGGSANCSAGVGLDGSTGVAVSADGASVYVVSSESDAVAAFDRDPSTGTIVQKAGVAACVSNSGSGGCKDGRGLDGAISLAVASDGLNVYVAAIGDDSILGGSVAMLNRNTATGELSQVDSADACVTETGTGDVCSAGRALSNVGGVVASPDGKSVYSLSTGVFGIFGTNAITLLDRDLASGTLAQAGGINGCVSEGTQADPSCAAGRNISGVNSGVVSPDGRSFYTAASASVAAIAIFDRDPATGIVFQKPDTAGCISQGGTGGCISGRGLTGASGVSISPDGRSVYAAGAAVTIFDREPTTGALTQKPTTSGCIADSVVDGCADGNNLVGAVATAVSPDGRNVYAAVSGGAENGGVAVFDRNSITGALTQKSSAAGCISDSGANGCTNGTGLADAKALAVSPDGKNVYVAAESLSGSGSVAILDRNLATGALTQRSGTAGGCISSDDAINCAAGKGLIDTRSVAVSADGKLVYVTGSNSNALAVFERNPINGALTQRSDLAACFSEDGSGPCGDGSALYAATGVAASPDSRSVYVASRVSGAIASFQLEGPTCEFTQIGGQNGCVSETGTGGSCLNANALDGASDVAVSADSRNLYTASIDSDAVAVFARDTATGLLTQLAGTQGCISESGSGGSCVDGRALGGAASVALSNDGQQAYVAAHDGNAVAVLDRDLNTGTLTQKSQTASCVSEDGSGSTCVDGKGLRGPIKVRLSHDDRSVYVVSDSGDVAIFGRDPVGGAITQLLGLAGCLSADGSGGACTVGRGIAGARSMAVSPDDRQVYVAAPGAVAVFDRNVNNGALTQRSGTAGCINQGGSDNCTAGNALEGVADIAVSADGRNAYVAANASNSIAVFDRDPQSGNLTQKSGVDGCISRDGAGGCTPGIGLTLVQTVHVSTNGRYVFALSATGGVIAIFDRDPSSGVITQREGQRGCISESGHDSMCIDGNSLNVAAAISESGDGDFLYVAAAGSDAIVLLQCGLCGDGNLDTGEQCDDDNLVAGDGCSASCTTESTPTLTRTPSLTRTQTPTPTDTPIPPSPTQTPTSTHPPLPTAITPTATVIGSATPPTTPSPSATQTATVSPSSVCIGDCGADGQVTVDELLTMIAVALDNVDVEECPAGDSNHDGLITVDEIVSAVNKALNGC